jgi:Glyceraldehyde 3-phosphate dehydrogenase, NAD binding domain
MTLRASTEQFRRAPAVRCEARTRSKHDQSRRPIATSMRGKSDTISSVCMSLCIGVAARRNPRPPELAQNGAARGRRVASPPLARSKHAPQHTLRHAPRRASHGAQTTARRRAGRLVFRIAWGMPETYTIVHINDIAAPESIAYLIKYDSIHGTWGPTVEYADGFITVTEGSRSAKIAVSQEADPRKVRRRRRARACVPLVPSLCTAPRPPAAPPALGPPLSARQHGARSAVHFDTFIGRTDRSPLLQAPWQAVPLDVRMRPCTAACDTPSTAADRLQGARRASDAGVDGCAPHKQGAAALLRRGLCEGGRICASEGRAEPRAQHRRRLQPRALLLLHSCACRCARAQVFAGGKHQVHVAQAATARMRRRWRRDPGATLLPAMYAILALLPEPAWQRAQRHWRACRSSTIRRRTTS